MGYDDKFSGDSYDRFFDMDRDGKLDRGERAFRDDYLMHESSGSRAFSRKNVPSSNNVQFTKGEQAIINIGGFLGVVFILWILSSIFGWNKEPEETCKLDRCSRPCAKGSQYCEYHTPGSYRQSNISTGSSSKSTSSKTTGTKSASSTSTKSNSGIKSTYSTTYYYPSSSKGTKSNKSMITDPEDYDNPDEYAEDAWGIDFDDYDDAYDYWEEY